MIEPNGKQLTERTKRLLKEVDAYLDRHEMTDYALGIEAVKDGHFVRRLRNGLDARISNFERLEAFIEAAKKTEFSE